MLVPLVILLYLFMAATFASDPPQLPNPEVLPNPNIKGEFSLAERLQITLAFRDAQQMAVAAYEAAASHNAVYLNYFPATVSWILGDPADIVQNVFKRVFAGQLDGCGKTLEDVTISKDYDVPGQGYSCTDPKYAGETIDWNTPLPTIILCNTAMQHGVVDQSSMMQGFPAPVTCDTIGGRTSWRMATLGATPLHEWTHIDALVGAALDAPHRPAEDTDDELDGKEIYGCVETQTIANDEDALYVADNYAWFATEAFWSKKCGRRFSNPGSADDQDPLFGGQTGAEAHPIPESWSKSKAKRTFGEVLQL